MEEEEEALDSLPGEHALVAVLRRHADTGELPSWVHQVNAYSASPVLLTAALKKVTAEDGSNAWFFLYTPARKEGSSSRCSRTAGGATWIEERTRPVEKAGADGGWVVIGHASTFTYGKRTRGPDKKRKTERLGWILVEVRLPGQTMCCAKMYRSPRKTSAAAPPPPAAPEAAVNAAPPPAAPEAAVNAAPPPAAPEAAVNAAPPSAAPSAAVVPPPPPAAPAAVVAPAPPAPALGAPAPAPAPALGAPAPAPASALAHVPARDATAPVAPAAAAVRSPLAPAAAAAAAVRSPLAPAAAAAAAVRSPLPPAAAAAAAAVRSPLPPAAAAAAAVPAPVAPPAPADSSPGKTWVKVLVSHFPTKLTQKGMSKRVHKLLLPTEGGVDSPPAKRRLLTCTGWLSINHLEGSA